MYSDCTNYIYRHMIITIFLMFWLYFMISLQIDLVFCVQFSPLTFLLFFYFICWIMKGILQLHNSANILGMLLRMLLSHVEIHIYHRLCF
jgi:hypothetical protein